MEQRAYNTTVTPDDLANALLEEWDRDDTIAQAFGEPDRVIVQIGQREAGWFGDEPRQALTLDIEHIQDGLQVTMGQQQWFKQGGEIMIGGLIGFFPFFFTFPLGRMFDGDGIDQTLPGQVWHSVEGYVGAREQVRAPAAAPAAAPMAAPPVAPTQSGPATGKTVRLASVSCPECGVANPMGALRCSACGSNLQAPAACPQCSYQNPVGANFCNRCGYKLNAAAQLGVG